ncbi:MAG: hypothetical protein U9P79_01720, partial [Candidatus Cloacimonadota bacterium]|nr:hypothetical protein [Candidatus Cloacimonadota bacterium]
MKKILLVLMMVFLVVGLSAKEEYVQPVEDVSPNAGNSTHNPANVSEEVWDVLYSFPDIDAGQPGIETNDTHIFTTDWRTGEVTFHKFDMDGTFVEEFDIAGATCIRDMAYDGEYFYGAAADMSLKKMDLEGQTLVETISATCAGVTGIRHIAYDPELDGGNGGFWIGNWGDFGAITMTGAQIYGNIAGIAESTYGSAYDPWTEGGPYLWLFCQTGSLVELKQFEIATQSLTGVMHDATDMPGYVSGSAGGCCTYVNDEGLFALLINIQQDPNLIGAYELAPTADPNAPGQPTDMAVIPDASGALSA